MSYKKHMRATSVQMAKASSSKMAYNGNNHQQPQNPFGPGMAESVFNLYDYSFDEGDEVCEDYYYPQAEIDPEDLYDGVTQSFHFRYQDSLDLETNEERERHLRDAIRRFEHAYRVMSLHALKWHYLHEDLEEHDDLKKMFRDIQMLRKLKGSDFV